MSLLIKPLYPLSQTVNSGAQKNTEELRNQLKLRQSPKLRMAAGRELRRQSTAGGTRQPRRQEPSPWPSPHQEEARRNLLVLDLHARHGAGHNHAEHEAISLLICSGIEAI